LKEEMMKGEVDAARLRERMNTQMHEETFIIFILSIMDMIPYSNEL